MQYKVEEVEPEYNDLFLTLDNAIDESFNAAD